MFGAVIRMEVSRAAGSGVMPGAGWTSSAVVGPATSPSGISASSEDWQATIVTRGSRTAARRKQREIDWMDIDGAP